MESGNEVSVEEKIGTEESQYENSTKVEEILNSSKLEVLESSKNVIETSEQSSVEVATNGATSENNKLAKNDTSTSASVRKPRAIMSHTSSFASKTLKPDGKSVKPRIRSKGEATLTNRKASGGVKPMESRAKSGGTATRRATLESGPSGSKSMAKKSNGNEDGPPSEDSLSSDQHLKPVKTAIPVRQDDDTHSTTSSGQRRNSTSGFSFKLDERAEKRKQFFSKLEEKSHAKEAEKTNLQEKSKESQEAEIKQLRKSLTFKAAPLPKFYKEPPPKFELKKIPSTRPKSPKLGRNKSQAATVTRSTEGTTTAVSPRARVQARSSKVNLMNRDKDTVAFKKPNRRSAPSKTDDLKESAVETEDSDDLKESSNQNTTPGDIVTAGG